jgi:hypothetical protein
MLARHNARIALRDELKDDLTSLLLSCGMALEEAGLSETTITRLRNIEEAANRLRQKLTADEEGPAAVPVPLRARSATA